MSFARARHRAPASRRSRFAVWTAALLAAAVSVVGLAVPAGAAVNGLTLLDVSYGSVTGPNGVTVVSAGPSYTARFQYQSSPSLAGQTATVPVPAGVTIPASALVVPSGNTLFSSLTLNPDGDLVVTYADPIPSGVNQGVFTLNFTFDEPAAGSEVRDVTWSYGGDDITTRLIVKSSTDELRPAITNSMTKNVGWSALASKISVTNGVVTLASDISSVRIPYTVTVDSADARTAITLADIPGAPLSIDTTSFVAELQTWDADGLNRTTTAPVPDTLTASGFQYDALTLPANSKLRLTYSGYLDAADVAALTASLQSRYNAINPAVGGSWEQQLVNTLSLTESGATSVERTATVTVGGRVAAPVVDTPKLGTAFSKSTTLANETPITLEADGVTLVDPVSTQFGLRAGLTEFARFAGTADELSRNVLIVDELPGTMVWDVDHAQFLSLSTASTPLTLTEAAAGTTEAQLAGDAYVGQYLVVGERRLVINVGRDVTAWYQVNAQALVVNVSGLTVRQEPAGKPRIETLFEGMRNTAVFQYSDTEPNFSQFVTRSLAVLKDPLAGINDASKFAKTAPTEVTLPASGVAMVPYTFTVGAGAVQDLGASRIIDAVDHDVFDVSPATLAIIKASITGTYNWNGPLGPDSFDVSIDADGNLVLAPSADFAADFPSWMNAARPWNQNFTVTVELPTHPIMSKQSLSVVNSAKLVGSASDTTVYVSSSTASASNYGDELEVRKTLYAGNGAVASNLIAQIDGNGNLVEDTFIYQVEIIPHGSFNNVTIIPIDDVIPAEMDYLGFVSTANLDAGTLETSPSFAMGANLVATWDAATRTVRVQNVDGQRLNFTPGQRLIVNFAVQITNFVPGTPIVNSMGGSSATIVPANANEFPLVVSKRDSTDASVVIDDPASRFTVRDPNGDIVTDEAFVKNGSIVVAAAGGTTSAVMVTQPGRYTIEETRAPNGYLLRAGYELGVTVAADGTSTAAVFYNEPDPAGPVTTGTVSIAKTVQGASGTGVDFPFTWTAVAPAGVTLTPAQASGSVVVPGTGVAVVLPEQFPAGTVVTFAEGTAPAITGVEFVSVSFTGNPATVVAADNVAVAAVNTYRTPTPAPTPPVTPPVTPTPAPQPTPGGDDAPLLPETAGNGLANSGANVTPLLAGAVVLLLAGAALLVVRFRRRGA